jgi:hypothetical protein
MAYTLFSGADNTPSLFTSNFVVVPPAKTLLLFHYHIVTTFKERFSETSKKTFT